jgi:hypothetical protein
VIQQVASKKTPGLNEDLPMTFPTDEDGSGNLRTPRDVITKESAAYVRSGRDSATEAPNPALIRNILSSVL